MLKSKIGQIFASFTDDFDAGHDSIFNVPTKNKIAAEIHSLRLNSSDEAILSVIQTVSAQSPSNAAVAATLANQLAATGDIIRPEASLVADVASTGGPSSLSTLLAPLFLREGGAIVPKVGVPGRPAGGVDCLAQIPNYRFDLPQAEVCRILASGGYAHFLAAGQTAPLDARMFRLRQQSGTQAVPTLVAASLLSKKVAVGITHAGLDIRVAPHGNFGTDFPAARANARLFLGAAERLSIAAFPILTDARFPAQPFLGRHESLLALHLLFSNQASSWLLEHFELCRVLAIATMAAKGDPKVHSCLPSDLAGHFYRNLADQGSSREAFEHIVSETSATHSVTLQANQEGFANFPLPQIRDMLVAWQAAFKGETQFPDPVGITLAVRPGVWISKGDVLATVRAPDSIRYEVLQELAEICKPLAIPHGPGIEGVSSLE